MIDQYHHTGQSSTSQLPSGRVDRYPASDQSPPHQNQRQGLHCLTVQQTLEAYLMLVTQELNKYRQEQSLLQQMPHQQPINHRVGGGLPWGIRPSF